MILMPQSWWLSRGRHTGPACRCEHATDHRRIRQITTLVARDVAGLESASIRREADAAVGRRSSSRRRANAVGCPFRWRLTGAGSRESPGVDVAGGVTMLGMSGRSLSFGAVATAYESFHPG